jgi:acetate kinase
LYYKAKEKWLRKMWKQKTTTNNKIMKDSILTINGGASTIKFSLYETGTSLTQLFYGEIESIGSKESKLYFTKTASQQKNTVDMKAGDRDTAVSFLMNWLEEQQGFDSVKAMGHRVVHGIKYKDPELITPALLDELKKTGPGQPGYSEVEIELIEIFTMRYPAVVQIACFDNSFPASIQAVRNRADGIPLCSATVLESYGFHGFSFEYLLEELDRVAGSEAAQGKVILAHLGNRKSLAAFKNGRSIDSSIDFTIPDTLTERKRDPLFSLAHAEKITAEKCGPVNIDTVAPGISATSHEISGSMNGQHAADLYEEEIETFCYETRKWIGSFSAVLGGLDTLVFTGGIGEHAPDVRSQVCDTLGFLGIELDEIKNMNNECVVSAQASTVTVRIIKTNEELMIARLVCNVLNY